MFVSSIFRRRCLLGWY